ncbi:4-alpha-glucanotransferase [soil metagenome]
MSLDRRLAGVLLHPTSLPGRFGIGDLGPECLRFLDWAKDAGLGYWQVLPLGPTSYGDSPYQCFSAFAGNPMLVSPEFLVEEGFARHEDLAPPPFPPNRIDYGWVIQWKTELLRGVFKRFQTAKASAQAKDFDAFRKRKDVKLWLDDYALFRACKDLNDGRAWDQWDAKLRTRNKTALDRVRKEQAENIAFHEFCQYLFFAQWEHVRQAARDRNIEIIGDAPIYVAYDSSDTWANQEIFHLDKNGLPVAVAGVPPDYFSKTGQLWGNPLYNWDELEKRKWDWWIARMESIFAMVDIVRLDHFRGFMGYWSVPFGEKTAVKGTWVKGPGAKLFVALKKHFKDLPIIAEDLGEITSDVIAVRDEFALPGMKIMQFAWGAAQMDPLIPDPGHGFHPHAHTQNCVVYTGTHDNDTTLGWWRNSSSTAEHRLLQTYLSTDGALPHWDLIRASFMSVANTAVIPMQDFLGLDSEARMNFPGKAEGNWTWRMRPEQMTAELSRHIRNLTLLYQRCATPPEVAIAKVDLAKERYLEG